MVYLDHAATTPVRPEAIAVLTEELGRAGNPSSLHASGRRARRVVEEARETIAEAFGARPGEVVFTSGGTESDNLAVKGLYWARRTADPKRRRVIACAAEHHAVLDSVHWLTDHEDAVAEWLPVDEVGRVRPEALRAALEHDPDDVALVSVMWANNEVGTVQPVAELAEIAHAHGIPFHTDAVQAAGHLTVDFAASGADALLLGRTVEPTPVLHGGGQERDVRSGTLDAPAVAAFAAAARVAVERRPAEAERLAKLRDRLIDGVRAEVPEAVLNGDPDPSGRLPGNAHFSFPGCEGDALLMLLDALGIECSTGSACSAGVAQPSHVLLAMGADADRARGSLRFSLGHTSTEADVDELLAVIAAVVARARRAG
jgi:cysteine desulfurase